MSARFRVWDPTNSGPEGGRTLEAYDRCDAARRFAELEFYEEPFEEIETVARCEQDGVIGEEMRVRVVVSMEPVFDSYLYDVICDDEPPGTEPPKEGR